MKKFYSFCLSSCLAFSLSAQTYLSEDFSGGVMPPPGWSLINMPELWTVAGSHLAGGFAPEGVFQSVSGPINSWLISPQTDLTGVTSVTLMFNHYYAWFTNPAPVLSVLTRSGGSSGTWHTVWSITPTGPVDPETRVITIANNDVGHADFQFSFLINGNGSGISNWYVDNILLSNPPALDAALLSVYLPGITAQGASDTLTGTVKNMGLNPITSFNVSYSVDGGSPVVYPVTGLNLALGQTYAFIHNVPLVFDNPGSYSIKVYVGNVNGSHDSVASNDTLTTHVTVVPWVPSRKVYGEETTGTWCGFCVRGVCSLNYMAQTYPDTWIAVSVHNNDPMTDTAYDAAIPTIFPNFLGYPSGLIDRSGDYYQVTDFEAGYLSRMKIIPPASVDVMNLTYDPGSRVVSFDVRSEFIIDVNDDLRFAAVISEDSCWGTTPAWDQHNYYAGGGLGPMCGFENLPSLIPASEMHYDHVARAILDDPFGTAGSLPAPVPAGSVFHHTYTYTLPVAWRFDKLHFIGLLMDHTTGEILNANNIDYWVGANDHTTHNQIRVYPNPFSEATHVDFRLDKTSKVGVKLYDLPGKLMFEAKPRFYPPGENILRICGDHLANGLFILELNIDGKIYPQKVSVVR